MLSKIQYLGPDFSRFRVNLLSLFIVCASVACGNSSSGSSSGATGGGGTSGGGTSAQATAATRVYGQLGSFATATANSGGLTADSLNTPYAVAADTNGLYIADYNNHRVLYFSGSATTATRVYGQLGNYTTNTANNGGISADSLNAPTAVAIDATGVYICDSANRRLLFYAGTSTSASRVYGQSGSFTTSSAAISATALTTCYGVALDSSGVYISDGGSHRVLYYAGTSTTASRVYGQAGSFTSNTANNGGRSATSLYGPMGIATDASGLYVADLINNRVLFFLGTSTTASRVYGQSGNFTTASSGAAPNANTLFSPYGVGTDSNGVYIADTGVSRILYFAASSTVATAVWGHANFTANAVNDGGLSARSLSQPYSVTSVNGSVFAVDSGNHRVLYYP